MPSNPKICTFTNWDDFTTVMQYQQFEPIRCCYAAKKVDFEEFPRYYGFLVQTGIELRHQSLCRPQSFLVVEILRRWKDRTNDDFLVSWADMALTAGEAQERSDETEINWNAQWRDIGFTRHDYPSGRSEGSLVSTGKGRGHTFVFGPEYEKKMRRTRAVGVADY